LTIIKHYHDNPIEEKILELFELVFKKKISEEFWRWRFTSNPLKERQIMLIWDDEELVSHYAVCPLIFLIEGKEHKAALSMTTMTHPNHNGKGYFKTSANALYKKLEEENYALVYGFPNSNSHYAFVKSLEWKDLERIPMLSLNDFKLLEETKFSFERINTFTQHHHNIFLEQTKNYKIKLNRDADFLNWRYINNPENTYDCFSDGSSFFVTKKFVANGLLNIDLCELYCNADAETINQIISFIYYTYISENIAQINFWLPLHDAKHLLMEKIGFKLNAPITFLGFRNLSKIDFLKYTSKDWFYSFGDSDVF
jgi:hypothetical protein